MKYKLLLLLFSIIIVIISLISTQGKHFRRKRHIYIQEGQVNDINQITYIINSFTSENLIQELFNAYLNSFNLLYVSDVLVKQTPLFLGCEADSIFNGTILKTPKIYIEGILFGGELDLMEIRLKSMHSFVDRFIIMEITTTHLKQYKGCVLNQTRLFKDFATKVIYQCVESDNNLNGLELEFHNQRLLNNLIIKNLPISEGYISFSHSDEFQNHKTISSLKHCALKVDYPQFNSLSTMYYGSFNKVYKTIYSNELLLHYYPYPVISNYNYINISTIKHHKNLFCTINCPILLGGSHLTAWPNVYLNSLKFLSCSECKFIERISELMNILEIKRHDKVYTSFMFGGDDPFSIENKNFDLPIYLLINSQKYKSFFHVL